MEERWLLDLFCGAGGCTKGYQMAGFKVRGVDLYPQPRYVGEQFIQADALEYLQELIASGEIEEFSAIHASPPCQAYSITRNNGRVKGSPELIEPMRELLRVTGKSFVIENVAGAPLEWPVMLCGASFALRTGQFDLPRHRYFESNMRLFVPHCSHRRGFTIGVYGGGTNAWHRAKWGRCVGVRECREAMGIDWMDRKTLNQAIPPAYTEFIGRQLMAAIDRQEEMTERKAA